MLQIYVEILRLPHFNKKLFAFMQSEDSLPCLQAAATEHPAKLNPIHTTPKHIALTSLCNSVLPFHQPSMCLSEVSAIFCTHFPFPLCVL